MTTKEFEQMFNQKFSIDVDGTFDDAITQETYDDDEDGECIDKVQRESSLDLSFGNRKDFSFSTNDYDDDFSFSFNEGTDDVVDDLYVGNEDFDSQFDLMFDDDDGLDVYDDCGDAEYVDDDDDDGECIDIVENE